MPQPLAGPGGEFLRHAGRIREAVAHGELRRGELGRGGRGAQGLEDAEAGGVGADLGARLAHAAQQQRRVARQLGGQR